MEFILFSNLGDVTILFLGCGTGWQENLYLTRDYTSCLFITVRNIQHLGSVLFLEIAHVGLITCAKYRQNIWILRLKIIIIAVVKLRHNYAINYLILVCLKLFILHF